MKIRSVEKYFSFGAISGLIGVCSDLIAPIGDYQIVAVGIGALMVLIGLIMVIKYGFSSEMAKSMTVFGVLLASISGWFLVSAPYSANAEGHNTGLLAANFTWAQKLQDNLMTKLEIIEKNTTEIAVSNKEISTNTKEISSNTQDILISSLNTSNFFNALDGKNYIVIETMCKSGFRSISLEVFSKTFGLKYYASDKIYNILKDTDCLNKEEICTNIVVDNAVTRQRDNYVYYTEPLSLTYQSDIGRIIEICGASVADKASKQIVEYDKFDKKRDKERAKASLEFEAKKSAFYKSCADQGNDEMTCHILYAQKNSKSGNSFFD